MQTSGPIGKVQAAEAACSAAAAAVKNPDDIPASQAVLLYETLERAGRAIAVAKTLLARRVADSQQWRSKGHGSAAEHLAAISGRSLGAARSELETSDALGDLDATKDALLSGDLSEAQGQVIANAAKANPQAEGHLIKKAKKTSHRGLRDEAKKAKAAADQDPEATHRRIHAERRLGHGTDLDGTWRLHANGTVVDGSIVAAELDRLTEDIFLAKGAAGIRECRDAYQFDALTEMARRSNTRHTRLDELDDLCHTHHDLRTRQGWALIPGTGDRPIVAPTHPRHPANAPPTAATGSHPAPTSGAGPPPAPPAPAHQADLFSTDSQLCPATSIGRAHPRPIGA